MPLFGRRKAQDADVSDVGEDIENSRKSIEEIPAPSSSSTPSSPAPSFLSREDRKLQALLAEGAYHLPGNTTWTQDWLQYFRNNHPLFSPCLQHPLHPISKSMRAVGLFGSIMAGLVITNIFFLWFADFEDEGETLFELSAGGFAVHNGTSFVIIEDHDDKDSVITQYTPSFEFSTGMLILWSVGSATHALFDITIWYATSCSCLGGVGGGHDEQSEVDDEEEELDDNEKNFEDNNGDNEEDTDMKLTPQTSSSHGTWVDRHRRLVNGLVISRVVLIAAMASMAVVIRATIEAGNDVDTSSLGDLQSEGFDGEAIKDKSNYEFLTSYTIELALAWFLWFPIGETILFSGILSCGGRIPCLGGRPAELRAAGESEDSKNADEEEGGGDTNRSQTTADIFQQEKYYSTTHRDISANGEDEGQESSTNPTTSFVDMDGSITTTTTAKKVKKQKAKKQYKLPDSSPPASPRKQQDNNNKPRPKKHPPRSSASPQQVKRKPIKHPPRRPRNNNIP